MNARVRLYTTIRDGEKDLRELWEQSQAEGWKRVYGGVGVGQIKAKRGDEVRVMYLEKRKFA
jgi:hypothetical protein